MNERVNERMNEWMNEWMKKKLGYEVKHYFSTKLFFFSLFSVIYDFAYANRIKVSKMNTTISVYYDILHCCEMTVNHVKLKFPKNISVKYG